MLVYVEDTEELKRFADLIDRSLLGQCIDLGSDLRGAKTLQRAHRRQIVDVSETRVQKLSLRWHTRSTERIAQKFVALILEELVEAFRTILLQTCSEIFMVNVTVYIEAVAP